jgi:hypothetical protein
MTSIAKMPQYQSPLVDEKGFITADWRILFNTLWATANGDSMSAQTLLVPPQAVPTPAASIYTNSKASVRIDKVTVCNSDASARTIDIWFLPTGQSATQANHVESAKSIAANTTVELPELQGQVLAKGTAIQVQASSPNVLSIIVSGTQLL